jgi:cytochrome c oxidase subunit 4
MSGHVSPVSVYFTIFMALMLMTGLTVAAAYVNLGIFNPAVALAIAIFKATLVILYFMHVKYSSRLTKLTLAVGLFFLIILLTLTLVDYASRGFLPMPTMLQ